jgi:hypothetical protein
MKSIWDKYHLSIVENMISTFALFYFGVAMHLMVW